MSVLSQMIRDREPFERATFWSLEKTPSASHQNLRKQCCIKLRFLLHVMEAPVASSYLSPSRMAFICRPIRQANSGPILAPGRNFSNRPPSQTSILSGCLYVCHIFLATLQFPTTTFKSFSVWMRFSPQNCLQALYPDKQHNGHSSGK